MIGLTKAQLWAKLTDSNEQHSGAKHAMAALETLLDSQVVCWAPSFDQEVLVLSSLMERLSSSFQGSVAADTEPTQDFQSLAGLQAETSRGARHKDPSSGKKGNGPSQGGPGTGQQGAGQGATDPSRMHAQLVDSPGHAADAVMMAHGDRAKGQCLLRPWLDHEGQLNKPFWSALTQRMLSVVMCNPGGLHFVPVHSMQLGRLPKHLHCALCQCMIDHMHVVMHCMLMIACMLSLIAE